MNPSHISAFFLEHSGRRIFIVRLMPSAQQPIKGALLHIPAIGEEMNKSRVMVSRQARALADIGYEVLLPDYYGTGDSEGDFCKANWKIWLADMRVCINWVRENVRGSLNLWGLRLGALMAMELAAEADLGLERLVLWNPVLNGEQFMTQFLRLRMANSMMGEGEKETVKDLRTKIEKEGVLEVAGYELSRELYNEIVERNAIRLAVPQVEKIYWAEVASPVRELSLPATTVLEHWREARLAVDIESVQGPPFWLTQEISEAPRLIERTNNWFLGGLHPGPFPDGEENYCAVSVTKGSDSSFSTFGKDC